MMSLDKKSIRSVINRVLKYAICKLADIQEALVYLVNKEYSV